MVFVHYRGMLRSPASWAKVARELLIAICGMGHEVTIDEIREDRFDSLFAIPSVLERRIGVAQRGPFGFTFSDPLSYVGWPRAHTGVGILVNESTTWPKQWLDLAHEHLGA